MKNPLIACCGLDCEGCEARIATLTHNQTLKEQVAQKWSAMNHAPEITADTIHCTGCRTEGVKFAYCSHYCEIRKCVYQKGWNTCGECPELEHCPTVGAIFQHNPRAKENLRGL
ncbi:MAG: DUF3795 domain-containing protein [Alistipes sp.]|nr:DUF3795 domain-containing protein [Alistipes sp.]